VNRVQAFGIGKVLAIIGLILVIVLVVLERMALLPEGLLFGLAFLAMLL